jgi:hypothetical protein
MDGGLLVDSAWIVPWIARLLLLRSLWRTLCGGRVCFCGCVGLLTLMMALILLIGWLAASLFVDG